MSRDERPYEVGYRKPPQSGKFTKGKSGNPNGRPKGSKNFNTIVMREGRQRVRVKGPDGTGSMTKLEAALRHLANKAAQGDIRSQRELFSLVRIAEEGSNPGTSQTNTLEADQEVMQSIVSRIERNSGKTASNSSASERKESK